MNHSKFNQISDYMPDYFDFSLDYNSFYLDSNISLYDSTVNQFEINNIDPLIKQLIKSGASICEKFVKLCLIELPKVLFCAL